MTRWIYNVQLGRYVPVTLPPRRYAEPALEDRMPQLAAMSRAGGAQAQREFSQQRYLQAFDPVANRTPVRAVEIVGDPTDQPAIDEVDGMLGDLSAAGVVICDPMRELETIRTIAGLLGNPTVRGRLDQQAIDDKAAESRRQAAGQFGERGRGPKMSAARRAALLGHTTAGRAVLAREAAAFRERQSGRR